MVGETRQLPVEHSTYNFSFIRNWEYRETLPHIFSLEQSCEKEGNLKCFSLNREIVMIGKKDFGYRNLSHRMKKKRSSFKLTGYFLNIFFSFGFGFSMKTFLRFLIT